MCVHVLCIYIYTYNEDNAITQRYDPCVYVYVYNNTYLFITHIGTNHYLNMKQHPADMECVRNILSAVIEFALSKTFES